MQELAAQHLVDQPVTAGAYRFSDAQRLYVRTELGLQPPFTINVWSEPLLGVLAVYYYRGAEKAWYFWVPTTAG